jgi:YbbR domain-containing protein
MRIAAFKWLGKNLGSILLALVLSIVVWISAVVTADPNEELTFHPVNIEKVGLASDLLIVGEVPSQVRLTLRAPRSIWSQLNKDPDLVTAWIDLSGYGPGTHTLEVKTKVNISPIRYEFVDPAEVEITLERLVSKEFPVDLHISGDLPLGYNKGAPMVEPGSVKVSGAESAVGRVNQVRANLDISGAIATIERTIPVELLDEDENPVSNVTVSPKEIEVTQPIDLLGGFKNVAVKVVTTGQVANGFRLTNIAISPPTVTLFSDDPKALEGVPGFVETLPVDLTGLNEYKEVNVGLNLPQGITLVRDPRVLVQVSVAAIEGSLTLTVPVEVIGLSPDLHAIVSPITVDIIVAGPLIILDSLSPEDFLVVLDLTDLPIGIYQRTPEVESMPDEIRIQTILPETVEVTIEAAPTPTVLTTPGDVSSNP